LEDKEFNIFYNIQNWTAIHSWYNEATPSGPFLNGSEKDKTDQSEFQAMNLLAFLIGVRIPVQ